MQHPESDVRTWQTKVVRREVADWCGRADFRAAIGFMHQRHIERKRFDVEAPREVEVIEAYCFAWVAFHPATTVYEAER